MTKSTKLVAEICLYGNGPTGCGAGWLARLADGSLLGDGEPKAGRSFTEAVFQACDHVLRAYGACGGRPRTAIVRVFASGGERMADTDARHPGYFGDLKWQPATVYVIEAADLNAAAS